MQVANLYLYTHALHLPYIPESVITSDEAYEWTYEYHKMSSQTYTQSQLKCIRDDIEIVNNNYTWITFK